MDSIVATLIPAATKESERTVMCPAHAPRMKVTARVVDVADVVAAVVVVKKVAHPPVEANRVAVSPKAIATEYRSTTISMTTTPVISTHEILILATSTRGISIRAASSRAVAMSMTMTPMMLFHVISTRATLILGTSIPVILTRADVRKAKSQAIAGHAGGVDVDAVAARVNLRHARKVARRRGVTRRTTVTTRSNSTIIRTTRWA